MRILHKFDNAQRQLDTLILMKDWPELCVNAISLYDVEKEIKSSAKAYLYFVRKCSRENSNCTQNRHGFESS